MYAKVFEQIFDSSIADNYELRHFFMDLLVLADPNGIVDKTPTAIAARTRIPLDKVILMLDELQRTDDQSRNPQHDGRRIEKLDEHRDWGWYIVNFEYYRNAAREVDRRASSKASMERHRTKVKNAQAVELQASNGVLANVNPLYAYASDSDRGVKGGRFVKPTIEAVKQHGIKIELPEIECEKFFDYYEANGWRVGRNPMKLWTAAMANWKRNCKQYSRESNGYKTNGNQRPDRSIGTANENTDHEAYARLGKMGSVAAAELRR